MYMQPERLGQHHPPITTRCAPALLACACLAGLCRAPAGAEDRVYLRSPSGQGESRVVGEVEEFTGVELVLRHRSGRQQTFKAADVLRIEGQWSAPHQQALQKFQRREYQAALDAFLQAFRAEKRKWVQREQLAKMTMCYRNLGKLELASAAFIALYRSDPSTMHFGAIPLVWSGTPLDAAVERRAATLLADSNQPAGQLIGASWLLTTAQRSEALQVLRTLSNAEDGRIIYLAEAQTWRTRQATMTAADVAHLQERIDAMSVSIRAGPYFLLGAVQSRLGKPEQAALAWMRVAINFPEDRGVAAQSLLAAAGELTTIKQLDEARELYREIIVDYADTATASTAQQKHAALTQSKSNVRPPDGPSKTPGE